MIHIEVHMYGNLRRFLPEGVASMQLELPDGATVGEVIERLGARHDIWVSSIGDKVVPLSARLSDGISLDFFPHLEGG
jgi:molybdopterin converting factor small subunit